MSLRLTWWTCTTNWPVKPLTPNSSSKQLPKPNLRLAVANAVIDQMKVEELIERLWREDPEEVRSLYWSITSNRVCDGWRLSGYHRRTEDKKKRKLLTRHKFGLGVREVAKRAGIAPATLVSLMEHHGILELVQFGLNQKRRLVSDTTFHAEFGHNVYSTKHIALEGKAKSSPFPVFYEDRLQELLWMLDYPGIMKAVLNIQSKKGKLAWLLSEHSYLPDIEIANLAGYSAFRVSKARQRSRQPKPIVKAA